MFIELLRSFHLFCALVKGRRGRYLLYVYYEKSDEMRVGQGLEALIITLNHVDTFVPIILPRGT
jgi:hypothetical protein